MTDPYEASVSHIGLNYLQPSKELRRKRPALLIHEMEGLEVSGDVLLLDIASHQKSDGVRGKNTPAQWIQEAF